MPKYNFNKNCEDLLTQYARTNQQTVARRLESLCGFLRREGEVVQTMFGGSVQKDTYVTGLSDVDALLIVNDSSLVNQPPAEAKKHVRAVIKRHLSNNPVRVGKLAVTVGYADGMEMQVLPAIRTRTGGVRIARPGARAWSDIAHPERFARKLAEVNTARDGRVVPVIKLAKAMAACCITRPERKIGGYHMESLAVDAFENYRGPTDPKAMLTHLLGHSIKAVMAPLTDSTGQTRFVDENLGPANSKLRRDTASQFGEMRAKVRTCKTKAAFNALFCVGQ